MMLYMTQAPGDVVKRPPRRKHISANIKRHHAGISQSSCSDGSLLSVGSSEMDDDSSSGAHPHDHTHDAYNSSEPPSGLAPLSHSAAKHKMAVRPRRTHGAPRRKKNNQLNASALPITPELNEELLRSTTPEVSHKTKEVVTESYSSTAVTKHQITVREHHNQLNRELQRVLDATPGETKTKSSSLPPGLALSQLMGQSPAKLSIAENDTPRSSIKRSKSSSQGRSLRDDSPKPVKHTITSESQIQSYHSEERIISRSEKYTEEYVEESKTKTDKKSENETRFNKKEESFFSRLLLRKSAKKSKKDQSEPDGYQESKKSKSDKASTPQYKQVQPERSFGVSHEYGQAHHKNSDKNAQKSAGQRAFANQMHRRLDNKGVYVQEGVYKDYAATKLCDVDSTSDLKFPEESNKNAEVKANNRREETFHDKSEIPKRASSKETVDELFGSEQTRKPILDVQEPVDLFSSKAFITNEIASLTREESAISPSLVISEEETPLKNPHFRGLHNDYIFHSSSVPKSIPFFNHNINVSASVSPPKSVLHHSSENVKQFNRSSEYVPGYNRERQSIETSKYSGAQDNFSFGVVKNDGSDSFGTAFRSLGEEYVDTRSSIGKSHSFRYASETVPMSSHDHQMPSLPAIVGISEPLLESWEINYRRSVNHSHDYKRVSARNYNLQNSNVELNYESLPSTDSSYLDSLKAESQPEVEKNNLYTNSILINESRKRDSDISQIEAKIDDIISSPKPLIGAMLKSSSLDSVQSTPEKVIEDKRKTVSVESALSQGGKTGIPVTQKSSSVVKQDTENFISVTHLNKDANVTLEKAVELPKVDKTDESLQKNENDGKTRVPEFLKIQLNKVDSKPATNVVLTANLTPKKIDGPTVLDNKEQNLLRNHEIKIINYSTQQTQIRKSEPIQIIQKTIDNIGNNQTPANITVDKIVTTPIINRKSIPQNQSPVSTPKAFFKRKAVSVELQDKSEKVRTNSLSTEGSTEKVFESNMSLDQKSHSSFGSKTSIQSVDSNEAKLDKTEEGVVFRKKPVMVPKDRSDKKDDDEPELMKVFARRSLKLKDSEAESLAQDIAEANKVKEEVPDNVSATRTKILKNEFNASIKSRDSDKENEEMFFRGHSVENKYVDIAARVSQFGVPHYQRSVSISSVSSGASNPKRESAPVYNRSEVNRYKKEISDSTPEKRLRNRTFPDPSNDREDIKNIAAKTETLPYKSDTLSKRIWSQTKRDLEVKKPVKSMSLDVKEKNMGKSEISVIQKDGEMEEEYGEKEKGSAEGEADASPQFKGILQMRAEWERRAMQGMTK